MTRIGFRPYFALALLLALAMVFAACGDDDDGGDGGDGGDNGSDPTATTGESPDDGDDGDSGDDGDGGDGAVGVGDNMFTPASLTVAAGTTVTWTWGGELPHSVVGTFDGEDVMSEQQTTGSFSFTFESPGTFDYLCGVHGQAMSGTIVVE